MYSVDDAATRCYTRVQYFFRIVAHPMAIYNDFNCLSGASFAWSSNACNVGFIEDIRSQKM